MRAASQPHVVDGPSSSLSHGMDVVEFEITSRLTAPPARTGERTLTLITLPHRAANVCGDVSSPGARACTARTGGRSELLPLQLQDQGFERTVEYLGYVPPSDCMAKESLRVAQLLMGSVVDRHPQA